MELLDSEQNQRNEAPAVTSIPTKYQSKYLVISSYLTTFDSDRPSATHMFICLLVQTCMRLGGTEVRGNDGKVWEMARQNIMERVTGHSCHI